MKHIFSFLIVLIFTSSLNAQWVVESFDDAVQPNNSVTTNWADTSLFNTNFFSNGPTSYMDLTNSSDSYAGTGSMSISYRVEAFDAWGGYNVRTNYGEIADMATVPYLDLSAGTELSLWYKVVTPADTTQGGSVFTEFKLAEYDADGNRDLWYHQPNIDYFDESGEWINIRLPLVQTQDITTGFILQFGDGDQIFQPAKVKAFEISIVYITDGNSDNPPSAQGEILFDHFQLLGNRYGPIETFDNSASTWGIDDMSWNAIPGAVALTDEAVDYVEGEGSLKMDYTLSAPEVWGGFVAIDKEVAVHDSMNERTALTLYVKNVTPLVADSARGFIRVFIFENSDGVNTEEWIIDADVDLGQPFDWTRCYLPLVPKPMGVNDRFPPKDGFALKNGAGDGTLNPESIFKIRIEPFGRGTEDGYEGALLAEGSILIDIMQTSGFQFADFEAPAAPSVIVATSSYSNLVTWTDVEGEDGEKYSVYASTKPIEDLDASGVELIEAGILEDVQVVEHAIVSANTDKDRTYYYAVTCRDFAGNVSEAGKSGAITNTARGIPTVSTNAPAFVADGNLSEWSGITPFSIKVSDGSGNIVLTVDDDTDLSADCYVALDQEYLYVAFDVNDDIVNHDESLPSYENDAPDLFIGLYDYDEVGSHVGYSHGSKPDYHLRFGKFLARNDQNESAYDSLLVADTENYIWFERAFPSGYVVEARIPLVDLETKRRDETGIIDTISWQSGYRIPFDFGINDNDGETRQGMMFYSKKNNDNGWQNVSAWAFTWINDDVVAVDDNPVLEKRYALEQNYPNPFNPSTQIQYAIEKPGLVKLRVYDILGRQVAELVNQQQTPGAYTIDFNASNYASGLYFYTIESGSFKATRKMMLLK